MKRRPANVQVHIERLVLRGLEPGTGPALVAALERELAAALADGATLHDTQRLRLGALPVAPGMTPGQLGDALGARIASALASPRAGGRHG